MNLKAVNENNLIISENAGLFHATRINQVIIQHKCTNTTLIEWYHGVESKARSFPPLLFKAFLTPPKPHSLWPEDSKLCEA